MKKEYKIVILIIGTALVVYLGFKYILPLIVPFLFAYFISRITLPIILFLHNKMKIPKMLASSFTVLALAIMIGFGVVCIMKTLIMQIAMLLKNMPIYINIVTDRVDLICDDCDRFFGLLDGSAKGFLDQHAGNLLEILKNKIMPVMTESTLRIAILVASMFGVFFIIFISIIMIIKDIDSLKLTYEKSILYKEIHPYTEKLASVGFAYLRAQSILISITTIICTVGLLLLKNKYALLLAIIIAIVDAFPVVGSGSVLVPWALLKVFQRDIYGGAVLFTIYLCCQLIRQALEPKLLGDRIGIKPIFMIMSIYAGIQLFGISGFMLGPIALVIIITVVQTQV